MKKQKVEAVNEVHIKYYVIGSKMFVINSLNLGTVKSIWMDSKSIKITARGIFFQTENVLYKTLKRNWDWYWLKARLYLQGIFGKDAEENSI